MHHFKTYSSAALNTPTSLRKCYHHPPPRAHILSNCDSAPWNTDPRFNFPSSCAHLSTLSFTFSFQLWLKCIILYYCEVCGRVVRQLCNLWSGALVMLVPTWHRTQLGRHRWPHGVYAMTLHPHGHSVTACFYFLIPSPFSASPQPPPYLATFLLFSVSMSPVLFCFLVYY